LIFKPRNQWHTFWNAGDHPARILEIILPAGFEGFFRELSNARSATKADPAFLGDLCDRYALEMDDSQRARAGGEIRSAISGRARPIPDESRWITSDFGSQFRQASQGHTAQQLPGLLQ
jgi:hypothetical protein